MTTETTERWDATWSDTGEHPAVNVTSAATLDGPIYTAEDAQRLAMRNALLTDQIRRLDAENVRLSAAYEQTRAELEDLRSELSPLDERRTGWTPGPKAMPRRHWTEVDSVADLTEQQQHAALVAPTLTELRDGDGEHYLGAKVAAEMVSGIDHKPGWPTWLGDVHHADATWTQAVTDLRSWADSYTARDVEHTTAERVEISDEYAEKRLAAELQYRGLTSAPSVYEQLGPDQIAQDSPADVSGQNREATPPTTPERATGRGSGAETSQSPLNGPEDRQPSPPGAHRTLVEVHDGVRRDALTTGEQPTAEPEPRKPWWRSEWVAAAGIVVGWLALIATVVVLA